MIKKLNAQHILVDQKFEAQDILKKLQQGESFEKLAQSYSTCGSAESGGHLGEFSKGMMVRPFEEAVLALKVGEVSAPIQTQFGYHIIKRLDGKSSS